MSGLEVPFIPQCKENLGEDSNSTEPGVFKLYTSGIFDVF